MWEIAGKSVLVTGGAGTIGSHVVDALLAEGAALVRVYDNLSTGNLANLDEAERSGRLEVVRADIRDREDLDQAMRGMDYVFHQASILLLEGVSRPLKSLEVNILGTYHLLEAAVRHKVKKLVAASSASVFGDPAYLPVDEAHPFNNVTLYGATKVACEQLYANFHHYHGMPYVALRYYNVYGPRQGRHGAYTQVIPRWFDQMETGEPLTIFGDGSQSMDLIFVGEIARANLLALKSDVTADCFNIGSGVETSVKELAGRLLALTGYEKGIVHIPHDVNLVRRRRCSTAKAEHLLGFVSGTSVDEGLSAYLDWRKRMRERR
ncbi:MAG: SDR family NAD(P)-dependent oxidoreductase [Candidatus Rokubacteria bacterium]|nr:SDR family NAD(P)-dependent oxidoreductase [Candidatus Rokubacteria bacterium]